MMNHRHYPKQIIGLRYETDLLIARRALSGLDASPDLTLEDKIRQVLQQFGTG